jgi:hypothetical protein
MIVLVVVVDSLRADAPSFAGGEARTPLLDGLATEGTWFADLYASGASTVPAFVSMLTGSFPHLVGVGRWRSPFLPLSAASPDSPASSVSRRPTLTTAFAAAGFRVACFHPYPSWGFLSLPGAGAVGDSQVPEAVVAALAGAGAGDLLAIVHHWWTHLPYIDRALEIAPWHRACDFALESLGRYPARIAPTLRRSYLRSVGFFSEEVLGRYLDAAGAGGREVLLVVVGDHGENWGESLPPGRRVENVYDLHGRWLTDATIRVPLLVWGRAGASAVPRRGRQDGMVRGIDVAPTIAALAGVPWPGTPPGAGPEADERGQEHEHEHATPLREGPHPPDPLLRLRGEGGEDEAQDHVTPLRVRETGEGPGVRLEIVGRSLAGWIASGDREPAEEALVVTSHNAYEPRVYPSQGPAYWRALGLRTDAGWVVWDGVGQELDVRPARGREPPGPAEVEAIRARLEAERLRAPDCGPLLPDPRGDGREERDALVERQLRMLGYLE